MKTLIKNISCLLTMDEDISASNELGCINDAAIILNGDSIEWIGTRSDLKDHQKDNIDTMNVIDAGNKVVMPGLIDAHTHLIFAGSRENEFAMRLEGNTYEEILAAGGGIHSTVKATRAATLEKLVELGKQRLQFCLEHGVTTVEIKSGYGLETETELKILKTIKELSTKQHVDLVPTFLGAHVIPKEFKSDPNRYIDAIKKEMLPEIKKDGLAQFCDVFIENGAYSIKQAEEIISSCAEFGLRPRLHIDQLNNLGGVELAIDYNAASVDHLETITPKDISLLAKSETTALILPGATFFLRMKKYAPAREMITAGVVTGLATDFNPGSCMTAMPFIIMTIACLQMGMTIPEVIKGFTSIPAKSLGMNDRGVLKKGNKADVLILNIDNYETIPYHYGVNHVAKVYKDGELVVG